MRALLLVVVVLVAGCGSAAVSTTTVATTTTVSTTSTTVATTTTSSTVVTTTTVAAVEGVPEEALALIGAEMPAVPDFSDGFDAEVWFEAYAAWNRWAFANPEEGLETLDLWVVPGSEYHGALEEQLGQFSEDGLATVATGEVQLIESELADELINDGFGVLNALTQSVGDAWILQDGEVVAYQDFTGTEPSRSFIGIQEEDGLWLVSSWEQSR